MPRSNSKQICVDFDGTIFDFAFPDIGPIKPGVKESLTRLREAGFWIIISSCRSKPMWQEIFEKDSLGRPIKTPLDATIEMKKILDHYSIPYDEISMVDKPLALYYIDDRGIRLGCPCCGSSWKNIADRIIKDDLTLLDLSPNEKASFRAKE